MGREEVTYQNFAGGELSPKLAGRYELPAVRNGLRRMVGWIPETQGGAKFSTGLTVINNTRRNNRPYLKEFRFNDSDAYVLEFTDRFLRFHRPDLGYVTEAAKTITGITQANPGVVTSASHGFANGDEVAIDSVVGMVELNGRTFIVAGATANTFQLTDNDGANINTTALTAYASGGTASRIYELAVPYDEDRDLTKLKFAASADTVYIYHPYYEPRKLTRTAHTSWTLSLYTRTNDPFTDQKAISGITNANPGVVTANGHGFVAGDIVYIEGVVGMTQINSQPYLVGTTTANTFQVLNLDGTNHNTTTYGVYAAGSDYASKVNLLPTCGAFYESRHWAAGQSSDPSRIYGSRAPQGSGDPDPGAPRYDDFTTGANPDDAVLFAIGNSEVEKILWISGSERYLLIGAAGAELRMTGSTDDAPIAPDSVRVTAFDRIGVADITPVNKGRTVMYVQRDGLTLKALKYDALQGALTTADKTLLADHISLSGFKQLAWQTGKPDILYAVRNDGVLTGMTFHQDEEIGAWFERKTGADAEDSILSICTVPRANAVDQLWVATERVIGAFTRRFIEYQVDAAVIPEVEDYYTSPENRTSDLTRFYYDMKEAMKECIHLDAAVTYDGTERGSAAGATVTPGAVTGTSVTFTASASAFRSTDVGRHIRKKAVDGAGDGIALITAFTSGTQVTCQILRDFNSTAAIAAGGWELTTNILYGLQHLEGRTVTVVADGAQHSDEVVSSGSITLDYQAGHVHVGLEVPNLLLPMTLEFGGQTGPSAMKPKHIRAVAFRFLKSFGMSFSSDGYTYEAVEFGEAEVDVGGPNPLLTGVKPAVSFADGYDEDKKLYFRQTAPFPCNLQALLVYGEADDGD